MPTEDRALSQFPTAAAILAATLVMVSTPAPDAPSGYDTNKALAADLGRAILGDFAYTQELQTDIKTIFGAINSLRVLSGTTTPTAQEGANGQLYFKYTVDSQTQEEEITNLYWKRNGAWLEVQLGGGGTNYIECTKAQYDAWEQAGTLEEDVLYFITDGQSGGGVVIDDTTTAQNKVWSSSQTDTEIQAVAADLSDLANDVGTNTTDISNIQTVLGGFKFGSRLIENNSAIQTPLYTNLLVGWVGRTVAVEFIASWSDIQYIKAQNGISATKLSDNRIQINNQSGSTVIAFYVYN